MRITVEELDEMPEGRKTSIWHSSEWFRPYVTQCHLCGAWDSTANRQIGRPCETCINEAEAEKQIKSLQTTRLDLWERVKVGDAYKLAIKAVQK